MNENRLCSCCLTKQCYKTICTEYYNGDRKEIYSEMLLQTFNINITNSDQNLICEACIHKLREATLFKQQVLNTQDTLNSLTPVDIKIEVEEFEQASDREIEKDFELNNKSSEKDELLVIKLESKKNKLTRKPQQSTTPTKVSSKENKIKSKEDSLCRKSRINKIKTLKNISAKQKKTTQELPSISQTEISARENTIKLIQNSNLCLFRSLKTKFGCVMCKTTFLEVSKLREHSITHTNVTLLTNRVNKWRGLSYKNAEISNLQCNKCMEKIPDLQELVNHLKKNHDFSFPNTNHFLIPYKLLEEIKCVICSLKFNTFSRLSMHMNSHYANNVCEICGLSYINRISLRMHKQCMHKEQKCSLCPAKFLTLSKKVQHLQRVHNVFNKKRYCNVCGEVFKYTYLLAKHKIEKHGVKRQVFNCSECEKVFYCEAGLRTHVRSVHIRERNHPCSVCNMRFFTKCDQKRHEKTHNDVRSFSCSYCDSKFKSKDSWKRHLKRQHGHVF
ncbi:uncharacterized protein LOC142984959 [Anticarsia gemmatalis]|uniref:uncharacterized protein LOC142984959 n=1 Tax=Anticarsia gemmatalis TaxID=129554 RepID=UPI003F76F273